LNYHFSSGNLLSWALDLENWLDFVPFFSSVGFKSLKIGLSQGGWCLC